ncbi:MAG TPA: TlpA disulfide reductase family protein [Blastocatellia bacterium]|nr:TlpA disulfide reductase family protein [Blastocatellia bacterium]
MIKRFFSLKAFIAALALAACLSATAVAQQDLTFTTPDGQRVTLSGMRGKVTLLVFSSVEDPQCRDLFKALQSLSERYSGKDVNITWVSLDAPGTVPNDRLRNPCGTAGSVIILRDQNRAAFKQFGGRQMPTIVILNREGQVQGQPRGGFNPDSDFINNIAGIIDSLLK